ncbi:hypothetical protein [Nonomuraea rhodomycinica]|uniref:Uncharacterized protein n=1 Tax=Nonomuraea rhodomycinica TaxID=1712872 RepID=A0A7Y6MA23_9ACTN|nr:hypothetical protein [Nonomuraea rhodomycinica]NUW39211.1 hypothetical protein [Nonomuraea rhodomycinica]
MTGRDLCYKCSGRRVQRLGRIFLLCVACRGLGWVGGDDDDEEPELEAPELAETPPVWEDPRWLDPMVAAAFTCRYCLGHGAVQHIDRRRGLIFARRCPCAV